MIPSSLSLILLTALFTLGAVSFFAWGWRRGFFRDLDAQSRVIFEPRDWCVARPWESPVEQLERELTYGDLVAPAPGEWGGHEGPRNPAADASVGGATA